MKIKLLLFLLLLSVAGFAQPLSTGVWRGVLKTEAGKDIPFNFAVKTLAGKTHSLEHVQFWQQQYYQRQPIEN